MIGFDRLGKNGRFGNQMFQYAALKGIAKKNNYDFCMPSGPKNEIWSFVALPSNTVPTLADAIGAKLGPIL